MCQLNTELFLECYKAALVHGKCWTWEVKKVFSVFFKKWCEHQTQNIQKFVKKAQHISWAEHFRSSHISAVDRYDYSGKCQSLPYLICSVHFKEGIWMLRCTEYPPTHSDHYVDALWPCGRVHAQWLEDCEFKPRSNHTKFAKK